MRPIMLVPLVGAALLALMVAASGVWQSGDESAHATPALVVGLDMDPTGNSCPGTGTTDCTLGSIETCAQVSAGDILEVDTFVEGLPVGEDFAGAEYVFGEKVGRPVGNITGATHDSGTINLLAQLAGSSVVPFGHLPIRAVLDYFESVGDIATGSDETNPPFTQGTIVRYEIDLTGVPDGMYGLTLSDVIVLNSDAEDLCASYGCDIRDANASPQPYGLIAVGTDCSEPLPTVTPTPTPTPAPTLTPGPSPTPTPTPPPPILVAGWNHVCYLGATLPPSEALADLAPNVLAVYRLKPDQSYDTWFAGRPDVSTMMVVNPYDALFLLMASPGPWADEPAGAAPTSLDLAQRWNSACYSGQTKDVQAATASIAGEYSVLYLLTQSQEWERFVPTRPDISDLAELRRFAAVLILVTPPEGAHWVFDP